MELKDRALKIYREKTADFIPPLIPETYYGMREAPADASMPDKIQNIGRSWFGGVGGKLKGMMLGGAAGSLAGLFHPWRAPGHSSARMLLDALAYGTAGAALGGTIGRVVGAKEGAKPPMIEQPNVYDLRG